MTPKFDKLLGALRENGAGAATSSVGDISYFAADPGAGWLKCDGKVYVRAAYPGYEAQRPDALEGSVHCPAASYGHDYFGGFARADGKFLFYGYSGVALWDPNNPDVDPVLKLANYDGVGFVYKYPSGRIVMLQEYSRNVHASTDEGENWTTTVNALPTEMMTDIGTICGSMGDDGRMIYPIPGTRKLFRSSDGITFTLVDKSADHSSANLSRNLFPNRGAVVVGDGYFRGFGVESAYAWDYFPNGTTLRAGENAGQFTGMPCLSLMKHGNRFYMLLRGAVHIFTTSNDPAFFRAYMPVPVEYDVVTLVNQVPYIYSTSKGRFAQVDVEAQTLDVQTLEHWSTDARSAASLILGYTDAQPTWFFSNGTYSGTFGFTAGYAAMRILRVAADPTRFHVPGLAPVGGAWPYVYVGA